jgi:hypothetical protein
LRRSLPLAAAAEEANPLLILLPFLIEPPSSFLFSTSRNPSGYTLDGLDAHTLRCLELEAEFFSLPLLGKLARSAQKTKYSKEQAAELVHGLRKLAHRKNILLPDDVILKYHVDGNKLECVDPLWAVSGGKNSSCSLMSVRVFLSYLLPRMYGYLF